MARPGPPTVSSGRWSDCVGGPGHLCGAGRPGGLELAPEVGKDCQAPAGPGPPLSTVRSWLLEISNPPQLGAEHSDARRHVILNPSRKCSARCSPEHSARCPCVWVPSVLVLCCQDPAQPPAPGAPAGSPERPLALASPTEGRGGPSAAHGHPEAMRTRPGARGPPRRRLRVLSQRTAASSR